MPATVCVNCSSSCARQLRLYSLVKIPLYSTKHGHNQNSNAAFSELGDMGPDSSPIDGRSPSPCQMRRPYGRHERLPSILWQHPRHRSDWPLKGHGVLLNNGTVERVSCSTSPEKVECEDNDWWDVSRELLPIIREVQDHSPPYLNDLGFTAAIIW